MNTWWGLRGAAALGRDAERRDETVAWLRACQLPGGGFTYQPEPAFGGRRRRGLHLGGGARAEAARRRAGRSRRLRSRTSHPSGTPTAASATGPAGRATRSRPTTRLDALDALGALEHCDRRPPEPHAGAAPSPLPADLKVFTIQIEAHGQGSPAEAVDLARRCGSTSGARRTPSREWLARARRSPTRRGCPSRSSSPTRSTAPGSTCPAWAPTATRATSSRPAGADFGPSLATRASVSWPEFRERRLEPLQKAGGRLDLAVRRERGAGPALPGRLARSAAATRPSARSTSATPTSPTPSRSCNR